ncbi:uncharacterized protein LOC124282111 [Haliotis rubra]|uniref:uncharacterized protein LOC124282111 n=1 Tax=Haliotis rubra TaxID=36100 RepID=UPI001EE53E55|nr:uncharacterized protein LOC124282111 [Haliotis rubra]
MSVLLLVAFCIWRRRSNKTQQCRDDNQHSSYVMDVACNPRPTGAMTGNLQQASVSPDGYTSLRFLEVDEGSHDTRFGDTVNVNLASEDMTLDQEGPKGFSVYPNDNAHVGKAATCDTHCDDTSNIFLATEDMNLDDVFVHCFRFSPDDNARLGDAATLDTNCDDTTKLHLPTENMTHDQVILHGFGVCSDDKASLGDVATLQQVTNDLTLDPVILQDARTSPHGNAGSSNELATPNTHYAEIPNALLTTEAGTLSSVCLQRPSGYKDDKTRLDTRRSVTSYIHPVPGDNTLDAEKEADEEDAEYTVINDNYVEDLLQESPYETIESLDDNDVENISQKDPYAKIHL